MQVLLRAALISAIIGTALLLFLSAKLEPRLINIDEIDVRKIDNSVKIIGSVTSVKDTQSLFIFDVEDESGKIKVIAYKGKEEAIGLNEGMKVEIIGKVKEYEGEIEIEANSIKHIKIQ